MMAALREAFHWRLFLEALRKWQHDKASRLGAALAYYTVFSLAPLLVIIVALLGLLVGRASSEGQVIEQISDMIGADAARFIQEVLMRSTSRQSGIVATITALFVLLIGAGGVFHQIQDALDAIWQSADEQVGVKRAIRERLLCCLMVLCVGFLLLLSLLASAVVSAAGAWLSAYVRLPAVLLQSANTALSLACTTALFALMFRYLPNVKMKWSAVWVGSFITACLFTVGKYFIGLYLGRSAVISAYGAAGSLVVIMMWAYYSAQIFLYGGEFICIYSGRTLAAHRSAASVPVEPDSGSSHLI
jgi:membrane protein